MSIHRRDPRKDANHSSIVEVVRRAGALWRESNGLGCDGWVGYRGTWEPWEIKDGSKPASRQKLTELEADMQSQCAYYHLPYTVIHSPEEALGRLACIAQTSPENVAFATNT